MKFNKNGFSIIEVVVSVIILSIFLLLAYNTLWNFSTVINYIDYNIAWLNMTKSSLDDVIKIRNKYFLDYPYDGWERFVSYFWTWTYKLSSSECSWSGSIDKIYLCKINDLKSMYEWPFDMNWNIVNNLNWIYYYRKIDFDEYNKFYMKKLSRILTSSWEQLIFDFTDSIYNEQSFLLEGDFENKNLSVEYSWLDISYYDINWNSSNKYFSNIDNKNLRYSKLVRYNSWSSISDWSYIQIKSDNDDYKIQFYSTNPPAYFWTWVSFLKLDANNDKNYYNLCLELWKTWIVNCDFNYIIQDNFYKKLIWIEKDISNIDFWTWYNFSFSWVNNSKIVVNLSWNILPVNKTGLFINPYLSIKNQKNKTKQNSIIDLISDQTSWLWVEIPDKPIFVWSGNTNTWYTSMYSINATTFLYDKWKNIDVFKISSKFWDINRYRDYYEE